jgi:hypothetical protein
MTPERINRSDDERLYQPRIHSRWIRELYRIRGETGDPITVLVDKALAVFVERRHGEPQEETLEKSKPASTEAGS